MMQVCALNGSLIIFWYIWEHQPRR